MKKDMIEKSVKSIVSRIVYGGGSGQYLKNSAKIIDDLGADEIDEIEIVMALEDDHDITIDDDEFSRAVTLSDLVDLVFEKVSQDDQF